MKGKLKRLVIKIRYYLGLDKTDGDTVIRNYLEKVN